MEDPAAATLLSVISTTVEDPCKTSNRSGNRREARAGWVSFKAKAKEQFNLLVHPIVNFFLAQATN